MEAQPVVGKDEPVRNTEEKGGALGGFSRWGYVEDVLPEDEETEAAWYVHKFGGTSMANIPLVTDLILVHLQQQKRKAVVASAVSGVTDALLQLLHLASKGEKHASSGEQNAGERDTAAFFYEAKLDLLKEKHRKLASDLLIEPHLSTFTATLERHCSEILATLHATRLQKRFSEYTMEFVTGYGEVWSTLILAGHLRSKGITCGWIDARDVLVVEHKHNKTEIDWEVSQKLMQGYLKANKKFSLLVITGYIASSPDGSPTTLKRNGSYIIQLSRSDFSASIFGALLNASTIAIWTDVDGVFSADPRKVPEAVMLPQMSYAEATELAYFGAKVVHPSTMGPAVQKNIPIIICNTFNAKCPGSTIGYSTQKGTVKGVSSIDGLSLILVESVCDRQNHSFSSLAQTLYSALRDANVSVIMVTQSCFEHLFRFAVPNNQADVAKEALEQALFREIHKEEILPVRVHKNVSIVAVVGDRVNSEKGTASLFFSAVGKAGINILAIGQGSAELSISMIVDQSDSTRAVRALHTAFCKEHSSAYVALIFDQERAFCRITNESSPSAPISTLEDPLQFIKTLQGKISALGPVKLKLLAALDASEKRMKLAPSKKPIDFEELPSATRYDETLDWDKFGAHIDQHSTFDLIIIDARRQVEKIQEMRQQREKWASKGYTIVTNHFDFGCPRHLRDSVVMDGAIPTTSPLLRMIRSLKLPTFTISKLRINIPENTIPTPTEVAFIVAQNLSLEIPENYISDPSGLAGLKSPSKESRLMQITLNVENGKVLPDFVVDVISRQPNEAPLDEDDVSVSVFTRNAAKPATTITSPLCKETPGDALISCFNDVMTSNH